MKHDLLRAFIPASFNRNRRSAKSDGALNLLIRQNTHHEFAPHNRSSGDRCMNPPYGKGRYTLCTCLSRNGHLKSWITSLYASSAKMPVTGHGFFTDNRTGSSKRRWTVSSSGCSKPALYDESEASETCVHQRKATTSNSSRGSR